MRGLVLSLGLISGLLVCAPHANADEGNAGAILTFDAAQFQTDEGERAGDPETVRLPHRIRGEANAYTFRFDKAAQESIWGVYVSRRQWNVSASVNGVPIGQETDQIFLKPNWLTPAYFVFPSSLLNETDNTVTVFVNNIEGSVLQQSTILGPVSIGSDSLLRSLYERQYFLKVTIQHFISAMTWFFCLISLVLWYQKPEQKTFFWFALTTLFWALHNTVKTVPLPYYLDSLVWSIVLNGSLLWFVFCGFVFVRSMVDRSARRFEWIVFAGCCVAQSSYLFVVLVTPDHYSPYGGSVFIPFIQLVGLLAGYQAVRNYYMTGRYLLLASTTLIVIGLGLHDVLIVRRVITGDYLLQFSAPVLLSFFMVELIGRFMRTLSEQERIYQSFGISEIRTDDHDGGVDWAEVRDKDREAVAAREKEKFRQELHDGISGTLVAAISSLQSKQYDHDTLLVSLRQCMSELRLLVDSIEQGKTNLGALLGTFRNYVNPQLRLTGMWLDWRLLSLDDTVMLDEHASRHLFRILQEVFTNIAKHSGASQVTLEASSLLVGERQRIQIRIDDNGKGFDVTAQRGNGLTNIYSRADDINARVLIESEQGTRVTIDLDVALSEAPEPFAGVVDPLPGK